MFLAEAVNRHIYHDKRDRSVKEQQIAQDRIFKQMQEITVAILQRSEVILTASTRYTATILVPILLLSVEVLIKIAEDGRN